MISENNILNFPLFENIKVSTKTYTSNTNLNINMDKLYKEIKKIYCSTEENIKSIIPGLDKVNKIKKISDDLPIPYGTIIRCKWRDEEVCVFEPQNLKTVCKKKWFRNSMTIVLFLDKKINFKICKNGTFQFTGCKSFSHPENCIKTIWNIIKDKKKIYVYNRGTELNAYIIPAMRNIDFSLGFFVDREKLASYINSITSYNCMLETSFGYTGVNIKVPYHKKITELIIKKISSPSEGETDWQLLKICYSEYLNILSKKEIDKKMNSARYNTFLVFHSGRCILSGLNSFFMKDAYLYFIGIIEKCKNEIEEKLTV